MRKYWSRLIYIFIILVFFAATILIPGKPAQAWGQISLNYRIHEKMADSALEGLGQEWTSQWESDRISYFAYSLDFNSPNTVQKPHRVTEYNLEYNNLPFDNTNERYGAEWLASSRLLLARKYYVAGDVESGNLNLGYAIHYIQDSVCPAHVFPFLEGNFDPDRLLIPAHTAFEMDTCNDYDDATWNNDISKFQNVEILTPADLRNKIVEAAKAVRRLPCKFVDKDGKDMQSDGNGGIIKYTGLLLINSEWHMSMEDIGKTMILASGLVQGAALWATQPHFPPEVGIGNNNVNPLLFSDCYNRVGGTVILGDPFNEVHPWGNGMRQDFRGGKAWEGAIILKNGENKAFAVYGAIWSEYVKQGGVSGWLGFPISDEDYYQGSNEDRISKFENGYIIWDASADETSADPYPSGIDLSITSITTNNLITLGGSTVVFWTVRNNGDAPSGSFTNEISLTDSGKSEIAKLGNYQMSSIPAKSSLPDSKTVQIPASIGSGSYFIKVWADAVPPPNGTVVETEENNNTAYQSVSVSGILVENAGGIWTSDLDDSEVLRYIGSNVAPRIVVEYADSLVQFNLENSATLDTLAEAVPPMITVEYAGSVSQFNLQKSAMLDTLAVAVSPRIVVEYPDSISQFDLQPSSPLASAASMVSPRIVVEYAGSITGSAMERPSFATTIGSDVNFSVVLQGASRPDAGWVVPLTVKFFTPGADVLNATPLFTRSLTTAKSGSTATAQATGITPGTYDISADTEHCLCNARRSVVIAAASTDVNMDILLEGDANNSHVINIQDFGILAASYGKSRGQTGFDERADFNRSDNINITDFGLLAANYGKCSPIDMP